MADSVGVRVGVALIVALVSTVAVEVAVEDSMLELEVLLRATSWAAVYVLRIDTDSGLKKRGSG